ncbi:hypothetical protein VTN77DRAFT_566 [Rasamsonia byssochlamydoides]|uniref:uncharacterized protein n=1 Tax=Rasamsonia byssochlamydoides TaxID=89139 RepID=UPI0037424AAC
MTQPTLLSLARILPQETSLSRWLCTAIWSVWATRVLAQVSPVRAGHRWESSALTTCAASTFIRRTRLTRHSICSLRPTSLKMARSSLRMSAEPGHLTTPASSPRGLLIETMIVIPSQSQTKSTLSPPKEQPPSSAPTPSRSPPSYSSPTRPLAAQLSTSTGRRH